ncbi:hypothetical protein WG909_14370 [Peptostreptococcaceae bacterium AGR-M142]
MEELILKDMEDIIQKLKEIPWFENCQQYNVVSKFDISYCNSVNSSIKHCSSTRWENLNLDRRENMRICIKEYRTESKYEWNDITRILRKFVLSELLDYVENKWIDRYNKNEKIRSEIKFIILNFLVLNIYGKSKKGYFKDFFYDELLKIYEQGYFPCGWKGTYPEGKIIIF